MELSEEQEVVASSILKWVIRGAPQTKVLTGAAGTGKTTLIMELLNRLPENLRCRTAMVTFTGKASDVLAAKMETLKVNCGYIGTIHSLFYRPVDVNAEEESVTFKRRFGSDFNAVEYSLIIVDELSMIDSNMLEDLLFFRIPVLFCGDNQQLTPISADTAGLLNKPSYTLHEVHRQAADNPIIQVATKIRKGEDVPFGQIGTKFIRIPAKPANVIPLVDSFMEKYFVQKNGSGTMLCAANKTRHQLNTRVREKLGFAKQKYPQEGEIIVCLKNDRHTGLKNGTLCQVVSACVPIEPKIRKKKENENGVVNFLELPDNEDECYVKSLVDDKGHKIKPFIGTIEVRNLQTGATHRVTCHLPAFKGTVDFKKAHGHPEWLFFDYGYALTVHKSQGSEWDAVLLFNRKMAKQSPDDYRRWLYTGATRAKNKLIMVG